MEMLLIYLLIQIDFLDTRSDFPRANQNAPYKTNQNSCDVTTMLYTLI